MILRKFKPELYVLFLFREELFEGDIVMDPRLYSAVTGENDKRDAVTDEYYLWPHARVPYVLASSKKLGK